MLCAAPAVFGNPTMYAIIATDGRQYKVQMGDEIQIDLREDAKEGDQITFDRVLLVSGEGIARVGKPVLAGASVAGEVLSQELGEKIYVQKLRRRKNYRRRTGHRQMYTRVRIGAINA
jgi:large subunit ribosomal protein L21